jgi:dTDP-L-rhamnose 4-epimerase
MKNVLITGGAGFIGSNLSIQLLQSGYSVSVLDILHPQIHGTDPEKTSPLYRRIKDKVHFIKGDVLNKSDWENALKGQQVVVHFAAETGTGQSMYEIERYSQINVIGTSILLDMLTNTKHAVEKAIIASSRSVYGEGKYWSPALQKEVFPAARKEEDLLNGDFECKCPETGVTADVRATDEDSRIQPNSIYGLSKYFQEQAVMITCRSLNIPCVALRFQNVYGPGQSLSNPYTGILAVFSTRIKQQKPVYIFEDGKESRDFIFIDDVVRATQLCIEKQETDNHIFNVGTGTPTTVMQVAEALIKNYGITVETQITGQFRKGDIRHNFADISRIKNTIGFTPAVSFNEGIRKFTDWVNEQTILEDNYERSLEEMRKRGLMK